MPLTPYELNIWSEIRDLLIQLTEQQDKIIEFYTGLEAEGEGRNKLSEGEQTELSNSDVS